MQNNMILKTFKLPEETIKSLYEYAELLNKKPEDIIDEALRGYFSAAEKAIVESNLESENAQTNLSYEEFWDGVDI